MENYNQTQESLDKIISKKFEEIYERKNTEFSDRFKTWGQIKFERYLN